MNIFYILLCFCIIFVFINGVLIYFDIIDTYNLSMLISIVFICIVFFGLLPFVIYSFTQNYLDNSVIDGSVVNEIIEDNDNLFTENDILDICVQDMEKEYDLLHEEIISSDEIKKDLINKINNYNSIVEYGIKENIKGFEDLAIIDLNLIRKPIEK